MVSIVFFLPNINISFTKSWYQSFFFYQISTLALLNHGINRFFYQISTLALLNHSINRFFLPNINISFTKSQYQLFFFYQISTLALLNHGINCFFYQISTLALLNHGINCFFFTKYQH